MLLTALLAVQPTMRGSHLEAGLAGVTIPSVIAYAHKAVFVYCSSPILHRRRHRRHHDDLL